MGEGVPEDVRTDTDEYRDDHYRKAGNRIDGQRPGRRFNPFARNFGQPGDKRLLRVMVK